MIVDDDRFAPGLNLFGIVQWPGVDAGVTGKFYIDESAVAYVEILTESIPVQLGDALNSVQNGTEIPRLRFLHAGGALSLLRAFPVNVNFNFGPIPSGARFRVTTVINSHSDDLEEDSVLAVSIRVPDLDQLLERANTLSRSNSGGVDGSAVKSIWEWASGNLQFAVSIETHVELDGPTGFIQNWNTLEVTSREPVALRELMARALEVLMFFQILEQRQFHFDNVRSTFRVGEQQAVIAEVFVTGYEVYLVRSEVALRVTSRQSAQVVDSGVLATWGDKLEEWQKVAYSLNAMATRQNLTAEERTINSFIAIEQAGRLIGKQHDADRGVNEDRLSASVCAQRCLRFAYGAVTPFGSDFHQLAERLAKNVNDIKHPRLIGFPATEESFIMGSIAHLTARKVFLEVIMGQNVKHVLFEESSWLAGTVAALDIHFD